MFVYHKDFYQWNYHWAVFVDDLLVTGNDLAQIEIVKQSVATRFALTDEKKLDKYLGGELEDKDHSSVTSAGIYQETS